MALREELEWIAAQAGPFADEGEEVAGVLAAETSGSRVYLCAYRNGEEETTWLLLDADGEPVDTRLTVRDAASLVALCEVAEDSAGGGALDELRSRLAGLRLTENPPGIDEAEAAVDKLERTIGVPPRVSSLDYLERVGAAARELEAALGDVSASPFAAAMKSATGAVEQLAADVEAHYKRPLS
ncbi:MAG: hypothetical protein ACRD08_22115 [Acidimicrobiales bacterium]